MIKNTIKKQIECLKETGQATAVTWPGKRANCSIRTAAKLLGFRVSIESQGEGRYEVVRLGKGFEYRLGSHDQNDAP